MEKIYLKRKISIVGLIPFICFFMLALVQIVNGIDVYIQSNGAEKNAKFIQAVSEVIHEVQKERGITGAYLMNPSDLNNVNEQRRLVDQVASQVEKFEDGNEKSLGEFQRQLAAVQNIRRQVNDKSINLSSSVREYSQVVQNLIDMELQIADKISLPIIASALKTLVVIEEAKENGGILRAELQAILMENKPVTQTKVEALFRLRYGVAVNVNSKSLDLYPEALDSVNKFKSASEWKFAMESLLNVSSNSAKGDYGVDPSKFFSNISIALDHLALGVKQQAASVQARASYLKSHDLTFVSIYLIVTVLIASAIFYMVRKYAVQISTSFTKIASDLLVEAQEVSKSSNELSGGSNMLSEASVEQAASLQETVASIDEISSMVQRNADAASTASKVSVASKEVTMKGIKAVEEMILSIEDIAKSNDEINNIVKVITEIGEKTKVINDIVFQTRLLSFNASVEAARAGEHGRGFAVVAEEVGNLAAMSGKASNEISDMITDSIKQVAIVVEGTKQKVSHGEKQAQECGRTLEEIKTNVSDVNDIVREIATASSEQAAGVREVTVAMQQLDQTTNQNTTIAQQTSNMASSLNTQAQRLTTFANDLKEAVTEGDSARHQHASLTSVDRKEVVSPHKEYKAPLKFVKNTEVKKEDYSHKQVTKKVSGDALEMPSYDDERFKDI